MTLKFYDDGTGNSYTAMGVPGQLSTSNVTSSSADLTLPTGVTGAHYYELSESTNNGASWTVVDSAIPAASIVSPATYSQSGLTSGATYQWRLRAKFASLISPLYSAIRSVMTSAGTSGTGIAFTYSAPNGVAHGNTITITPNSGYTIPQRTNVKPVRVELDGNSGNSLGRQIDDYRMTTTTSYTLTTTHALGSIAQVWTADLRNLGSNSPTGGTSTFTSTVPISGIIDYQERYYDWNFLDTSTWSPNADGARTQAPAGYGNNLKTNRFWGASTTYPDVYVGYQAGDNTTGVDTSQRITSEVGSYYPHEYTGKPLLTKQWVSEEIRLYPSSAVDTADGELQLWRFNTNLSSLVTQMTTQTTTYPNPYSVIVQDEISNGPYPVALPLYYAYRCVDDEHPALYVGDAATQSACTKMVRLPQTSWPTSGNPSAVCSAQLVESVLTLSGSYLYMLTARNTWLSTDGVSI